MNLDLKIFNKNAEPGLNYINVGVSSDLTIAELAKIVKQITEYSGVIEWDPSKPDGPKKKILDSSRIFELGWKPEISLKEGLIEVYENFKIQYEKK